MVNFKIYNNLFNYFIIFLVLSLVFRGIINNFVLLGLGTALVDIALFLCILMFFMRINYVKKNLICNLYLLWSVLCAFILSIQILLTMTDIQSGLLSYRNDILYFIPVFLFLSTKFVVDINKLYLVIVRSGTILCAYAIFQFIGRGWLPKQFLVPLGEVIFDLSGTDIIRVNGLIGNTIIFSGYVNLLFSLILAKLWYENKNKELYFELMVVIIANLFTFSRASNAGMFLIFIVQFILFIKFDVTLSKIKILVILLFVLILLLTLSFPYLQDTILFERIFNSNSVWNVGSDNGHIADIIRALEAIIDNPILGVGAGTVGYSSTLENQIVQDGSFWIYLVEWGIFLNCLYWMLIFIILYTVYKNLLFSKMKRLYTGHWGISGLSINIYLIMLSFVNSQYSARNVLILNSIILGCSFLQHKYSLLCLKKN